MHLLEAILALHGTAPDPALLDLAGEIVGLFRRHFFIRTSGTLAEFFAADWSAAPGAAGALVEPGHHYEWVWLLQRYQALSGEDVTEEADALYAFAERFGTNAVTGFIVNALNNDGTVRDGAARLWPQTEELKAHLAIAERRDAPAADKVERVVGNLLNHYLRTTPNGAWIDVFDEAGNAAVSSIPASSLYHIFVAFAELDRTASEALSIGMAGMPPNRPEGAVRPPHS
jgi:mannose/cellobiose epimerase-like protein (N-acyl-D-glucosamine 2-epimerase family)